MRNKKSIVNGDDIQYDESFKAISNQLIDLIAKSSIWVLPENVLPKAVYPDVKRGEAKNKGKIIDGIRIDDNTYANRAIKVAVSKSIKFEGYAVCHIWPKTTYDERYHTLLQNLVLIPRILAALSDYYEDVINVLKYRAYELYGWYPEGEERPIKPDYYPQKWGDAIRDTDRMCSITEDEYIEELDYDEDRDAIEIEKVKRRVPSWIKKPSQINSRILNLYMTLSQNGNDRVTYCQLKRSFECQYSQDKGKFDRNYNQMKNYGLKNHGKVFIEYQDKSIVLWKPIADFIRRQYNHKIV